MIKTTLFMLGALTFSACAQDHYYAYGERIDVSPIHEKRGPSQGGIRYYTTSRGQTVGVNNELLVKCDTDVDCPALLADYGLKETTELSAQLYLITLQKEANVFAWSQKLHGDERVVFAHPNFVKTKKKR